MKMTTFAIPLIGLITLVSCANPTAATGKLRLLRNRFA